MLDNDITLTDDLKIAATQITTCLKSNEKEPFKNALKYILKYLKYIEYDVFAEHLWNKLRIFLENQQTAFQLEAEAYNKECENLLKENEELHQTLREIKYIAGTTQKNLPAMLGCKDVSALRYDEIIQIIENAEDIHHGE